MNAARLAVFALETAASLAAGLAIAQRLGSGRAIGYVVTTIVWSAAIIVPAHALAMLHVLSFWSLAATSLAASAAVLALLRPERANLLAAARALATGPFWALRLAARQKSILLVGFVFAASIVLWCAVSAWLSPQNPNAWDPFWYHEPMVGFAIQNHSFEPVPLMWQMQRINGFPRGCEMLQMWLAMVFGRTLIDFPNILAVPGLVSAVYLLCRRVSDDVLTCIGWGVVTVVIPAFMVNLQSSHNDPNVTFFVVAAIWLATLERVSLWQIGLAALALGLTVTAKSTCLSSTCLLCLLVLVRVIATRGLPRSRVFLVTAAGAAFVIAMGCTVYLRNYLNFHNPFWYELKVDIPSLDIHWPGRVPYRLDVPPPHPEAQIDENIPTDKLIDYMFAAPNSVHDFQYGQVMTFGLGVIWIVFPMGLVGAIVLAASHIRSLVRRLPSALTKDRALYLLGIAALAAVLFTYSPARWAPRYHLVTVTLVVVIACAFTSREGFQRLGESACGAVLICSIMNLWWEPPFSYCTWSELKTLAPLSMAEREFATEHTPYITAEFGRLRERLQEGDLLVVRNYGLPGLMWNNSYSNRVEYVQDGPSLFEYAYNRHAQCAVVAAVDPDIAKFRDDKTHWKEVTLVNRFHRDFSAFWRVP